MKKKALWAFVLIVIVAVGGYLIWTRVQSQSQAALEILRTAELTRGQLELTVASSGNVVVDARYELTFRVPGTVTEVNVEMGDRVEVGRRLAALDDQALRDALRQVSLDLAQAELNLEQLQESPDEEQIALATLAIQEGLQAMSVAEASREVAAARAELNQSRAHDYADAATDGYEATMDALERLGLPEAFGAGATAAAMEAQGNVGITQLRGDYSLQQARSQYQSAFERYTRAQQTLRRLQEGSPDDQVRSVELSLEQVALRLEQAEADLKSAILTSPTRGVVAAVNVTAGGLATTAMPAIVILDDSLFYVDLLVDEIDIGLIEEGQPAQLILDAYPTVTIDGIVASIGMLPETSTGSVAYPVRIIIEQAHGVDIREGMTASATITTDVVDDVLRIPNWAIRSDTTTGQLYTYRMVGGQPERTVIEIGASNETWTEVLSGVEVGTTVASVVEARSLLDFQGPPSRGSE